MKTAIILYGDIDPLHYLDFWFLNDMFVHIYVSTWNQSPLHNGISNIDKLVVKSRFRPNKPPVAIQIDDLNLFDNLSNDEKRYNRFLNGLELVQTSNIEYSHILFINFSMIFINIDILTLIKSNIYLSRDHQTNDFIFGGDISQITSILNKTKSLGYLSYLDHLSFLTLEVNDIQLKKQFDNDIPTNYNGIKVALIISGALRNYDAALLSLPIWGNVDRYLVTWESSGFDVINDYVRKRRLIFCWVFY